MKKCMEIVRLHAIQRGAIAMALSPAELRQFVVDGFVVKRGLISTDLCAAARDKLWEANHL